MKIAIFSDTYFPQINGIVTSLDMLSKGLADRGHQVFIITPKFKGHKDIHHPNIKILRVSSIPALFYEDFKFTSPMDPKIFSFLKKEDVDIIHFLTPISLGLQAINFAKLSNLPLIGTFHTFFADEEYLKHLKVKIPLLQKMAWKYSNMFYNRCDLVTVPSPYTRKELSQKGCKKPIKVISNGIKLDMFDNKNAARLKAKYGKGKILLFVGRIAHEKNIEFLLEAFKRVLKSHPETRLLLVGDGPQMHEVKMKIKHSNLGKSVHLLGKIEHTKLVTSGIYGASDIFVTASKTENQPITILEAQANSLACVVLAARGQVDLVKTGVNGILVENERISDFSQAINYLIEHDEELEKLKKGAEKLIQEHDINRVITEWEKTYSEQKMKTKKTLRQKVLALVK